MLFVFSFRVFLEKFRNNTAALATIAVFLLISTDQVKLLDHNCKYPADEPRWKLSFLNGFTDHLPMRRALIKQIQKGFSPAKLPRIYAATPLPYKNLDG